VIVPLAAFVAGGWLARRPGVTRLERRWFRAVNRLPASLHPPVWAVMQLGSLGGVAAVAGAAHRSGRPVLARRLAVAGTATWVGAKLVKRFVGRGRPAGVLDAARVLGREQTGLGYPSGHAAVAASLATVVAPELPLPWRRAAWAVAAVVGPTRMYVGAHLPLDVVGGIAFGMAAGAVARAIDGQGSSSTSSSRRSS
jgi:undecaprenyl-diphosphatase